jgi:acyl-CoA reductase-like NAD-dependent aldehyde dehydrogenase
MYVDGGWTGARSGATCRIPNPATEEDVAEVPNADREDMRLAIAAARRAFDGGPWRRTTPADRRKVLLQIADGLERRKEEARALLVSAAGAEWVTHMIQLETPIELLRTYADLALRFEFEEPLPVRTIPTAFGPAACSSMVVHQPVGVCGLIPTWNFPLFVSVQKLGPAIACGNTMVFKPSPYMPLIDLLLADIIEECDLPKGVYNVVTGDGADLGAELVESPFVDKVSFTGSVATGKRIMESASRTLKRVHLELGGKSATLILDDANLDEVASTAASPSFFHAGQGCALCTRVLVPAKMQDALLEKMSAFVQTVVQVGDPADPSVMLGPVIREERRQKIEEYVQAGKKEGALLVTGGNRPKGLSRGFFLEPTIFGNVRNDMRIAREEIFGPVVSVIPYSDEDEAVRIANDSSFGLGGAILTRDTVRAIDIARRIRTGTVGINGGFNLLGPFGGFKDSGIGRESGIWGMQEYTEIQCVAWV